MRTNKVVATLVAILFLVTMVGTVNAVEMEKYEDSIISVDLPADSKFLKSWCYCPYGPSHIRIASESCQAYMILYLPTMTINNNPTSSLEGYVDWRVKKEKVLSGRSEIDDMTTKTGLRVIAVEWSHKRREGWKSHRKEYYIQKGLGSEVCVIVCIPDEDFEQADREFFEPMIQSFKFKGTPIPIPVPEEHSFYHSSVTYIDLNGQGDYLEVKPGEMFRITTECIAWAEGDFIGRTLYIVIGLDERPLYSQLNARLKEKGPGNWERQRRRTTAPEEPGIYYIMRLDVFQENYEDVERFYNEHFSQGEKIATIKVIAPEFKPTPTIKPAPTPTIPPSLKSPKYRAELYKCLANSWTDPLFKKVLYRWIIEPLFAGIIEESIKQLIPTSTASSLIKLIEEVHNDYQQLIDKRKGFWFLKKPSQEEYERLNAMIEDFNSKLNIPSSCDKAFGQSSSSSPWKTGGTSEVGHNPISYNLGLMHILTKEEARYRGEVSILDPSRYWKYKFFPNNEKANAVLKEEKKYVSELQKILEIMERIEGEAETKEYQMLIQTTIAFLEQEISYLQNI